VNRTAPSANLALTWPSPTIRLRHRFTTFWRMGKAIHNFGRGDSQLGLLDSQLGSQLLAGKRARMAISEQRSPFSRYARLLSCPSSLMLMGHGLPVSAEFRIGCCWWCEKAPSFFRPATVALLEIHRYQKSTELLILNFLSNDFFVRLLRTLRYLPLYL
jgi:hypothetical protein